jgi:hypothetical protein
MIRHLKNFKRAITGNGKASDIENALIICVFAFFALESAQILFGAV